MQTKEELEDRLNQLVQEHGPWTYDIPLPHGIWTDGNKGIPHTRLKRVTQIIHDMAAKPISDCRVLDLGCLDGLFSIEFALQGASVTGIEIRPENIAKALFAKEALRLDNLEFVEDDVRNLSLSKYGRYDVILCSGLLYHLDAPDAHLLIEKMYEMSNGLVIIDTHISLDPNTSETYKGRTYHGHVYQEHAHREKEDVKSKRLWASSGNDRSFWFTRPSLVNFLAHAGFSSVYECFNPPHLNYGKPGFENVDRCTFVAVRGKACDLSTSPTANQLQEDWPEESLSYASIATGTPTADGARPGRRRGFFSRLLSNE